VKTRPLPPHLKRWYDKRTGKTYLQFRKRSQKLVSLPQPIGSDEFWIAYNAALKGKVVIGADRSTAGSVSAAIAAYYISSNWTNDALLSDGTRAKRRPILERFRERYGQQPLRQITENFIEAYIGTMKPHAARNHLKALRAFLKHAKHDVTHDIKAPAKSTKHPSWTVELIAQYEATHAVGTKARLCIALAKYTGAGRNELTLIGPQHLSADEIKIPPRQKTGQDTIHPLHPDLKAIIEATPITGLSTLLVTKTGKRYAPNDLSNQFRQWCNEAGIPAKYSLHGLRHSMGDTLAELGLSPNEIAAVLAHGSAKSALHYTQGADRKKMARNAMGRLIASTDQARSGNKGVSEDNPPQTHRGEKA
jgi:site-specific recombinase XerD